MIHPALFRPILYTISFAILFITFLAIRLVLVLRSQHSSPQVPPRKQRPRDAPVSLAILLGSGQLPSLPNLPMTQVLTVKRRTTGRETGGHTAEMMRLIAHLDWNRYCTRTWIISSGDTLSESKALQFENMIGSGQVSFTSLL